MGLTEDQKNLAIAITGKASGAISVVASMFIIRDIYKKWKANRHSRNKQLPSTTLLVLSMSVGDVGSSFFAFFIGSWMIPTEGDFPMAAGTEATCDAQAFLFGLFYGSSNMTNGIMALVYWLVICREKPEKELGAWYWRGLMFGYPWLWGIAYAAASRYTLAPAEFPLVWYCYGMFAEPGTKGATISFWVVFASFVLTAILIVLSMGALVGFVYKQEKTMDRFRRQPSSLGEQTGSSISTSLANRVKTIQVAKQGFLYTAAFLVMAIPTAINGYLLNISSGGDYSKMTLPMGYYVFYAAIFPLQGFFNFFIYFRPKFAAVRQREDLTFGQTILRVLHLSFTFPTWERRSELDRCSHDPLPKVKSTELISTEGSTFDGQMKRMSATMTRRVEMNVSTEMETSKAEGVGIQESIPEEDSPPVKAVGSAARDSFSENDSWQ